MKTPDTPEEYRGLVFHSEKIFSENKNGAEGRTRTGTLLPTADFESAASANSATSALRELF